jgi:hypothetical protein
MSHDLSKKFDRPLRVELRPSGLLLLVSLAVYVPAVLLCLGPLLPGVLLIPLGLHFCYVHGTHIGAWLPTAVAALSWDAGRGWRLRQTRGDWLAVEPVVPLFVSRRLVAVRFRAGRFRYRSVLVLTGRCAEDEFRRLRVRLLQSPYGDRNRAKVPGA